MEIWMSIWFGATMILAFGSLILSSINLRESKKHLAEAKIYDRSFVIRVGLFKEAVALNKYGARQEAAELMEEILEKTPEQIVKDHG